MKGIFVTIEGPDGAGKTSVIRDLVPMLSEHLNLNLVVTREPGGIPIAEKIRSVILDPQNMEMDERTEALLYAAARRQHLMQKVVPALNKGSFVLCDRFVDSSLAYQGSGRKIGMDEVAAINHFATEGLEPNLTLYLDVDSDTGLSRIQKGRQPNQLDRLDTESPEFHQRVRHAYLKIATANTQRIVTIDARQTLEEVVAECYDVIVERFASNFR